MNPLARNAVLLALVTPLAAQQAPNPLQIEQVAPHQFALTWFGDMLRPYQIEGSADLITWADIGDPYIGSDEPLGDLETNTALKFFYRLREGAMRPGFDEVEFGRNDDMTYPDCEAFRAPPAPVNIGFDVNFFGTTYSHCYVNNNGNITFDQPLFNYTPFDLGTLNRIMIAPFWADVDTSNPDSGLTCFSEFPEDADGHPAFGVTWRGVGYFYMAMDKNDSFQMLLIDRSSDFNPGDFDIEFNYNQIQWETGDASRGSGGLGGDPARVGWANGSGRFMEYKGSAQTLAFLDQKPGQPGLNFADGLKYQMWNSTVPGRIVIPVRSGIPEGAPGYDFQVSAGADQTFYPYISFNTFTLTGTITPPDTTGVTYEWTQVNPSEGHQAVIANSDALTATVTIPEPGEYIFRLKATKAGTFFSSSSDEVVVNHMDEIHVEAGNYEVSASSFPSFFLWSAVARYNGVNMTDVVWEQIDGAEVAIFGTDLIQPWIAPPGPGVYRFRLTARSGEPANWLRTSEATVTITE